MENSEKSCSGDSSMIKNIGLIFSTHYEIIELCLKNLPTENLYHAARVCKSWNHVVQNIRKERTKFRTYGGYQKSHYTKGKQDTSAGYITGLMAPTRGFDHKFSICFATSRLLRAYQASISKDQAIQLMNSEIVHSTHPACARLLAISDGVIGSTLDAGTFLAYRPALEAFTTAVFPELPQGAAINLFTLSTDDDTLSSVWVYENGKKKPFPSPDCTVAPDLIKGVLYLTTPEGYSPQILYSFFKRQQPNGFALGGCVVHELAIPSHEDSLLQLGLIFSGADLHAASVVLMEQDSSDQQVEAKIAQLKQCNFPLHNSLGFMFSCVGRPRLVREVAIFSRLFPNTKLMGLVGQGEVGLNHLPKFGTSQEQDDASQPKRRCSDVEHGYTSIFLLISW